MGQPTDIGSTNTWAIRSLTLIAAAHRMAHPGPVVLPTNERTFIPSRQTALLLSSAGRIVPKTRAL